MTLALAWTYVKGWAKRNWELLVGFFGAVAAWWYLHTRDTDISKELKDIEDAHNVEIDQIKQAQATEEKQHQADVDKLNTTLQAVQNQYDAQMKQLDDQKKQEITSIVQQYGNDPQALAEQLSNATGFKVVLPE